jgi:hypothetical protein
MLKKWVVSVLVAAQALAVAPVFASTKGRQNTAALLTAGAVYSIYKYGKKSNSAGRRNTALLTTGAAALAWNSYNQSKRKARQKERARTAYYKRQAEKNRRLANYYKSRAYRSKRYARR